MKCARGASAERGAATAEYALVSLVIVSILLLPLPGLGDSLVGYVLSSLRQFQASTLFHLSLP